MRISVLKGKPPTRRYWVPAALSCGIQNPRPVLLRFLEERVAVDVVHEHNPEHGGQSKEAPTALDPLLHDHDQQVGDERHPDLYLDGIGALPVEVPQREVLLELLEELMRSFT